MLEKIDVGLIRLIDRGLRLYERHIKVMESREKRMKQKWELEHPRYKERVSFSGNPQINFGNMDKEREQPERLFGNKE